MMRRAFTLIETLAVLLVVVLGLAGAVGMFTYGLRISTQAEAAATAMPTAMSVAVDAAPLLDPDLASAWTSGSYDFNDTSRTLTATTKGIVNGFYVQRSETTVPADIIAQVNLPPVWVMARSVQVDVDVYDAAGSRLLASYSTRFVRQRPGPVP